MGRNTLMLDPVVFLPGLMGDITLFRHQINALSLTRSVMFTPLLGASVEEMATAALATAPARCVLVGQGLGGDVALEVVRRAMDRVARLVILSTDPLTEAPHVAAEREARMVAARAGRLRQVMAEEVPIAALAPETAAEVAATVWAMAENLGEGPYLRQSRALQRRPDQQKTLRRAMVPTLVLAGASDTLVPLRRQEFVAGLMPFAAFQVIKGAGHLPTLEQPEPTLKAIETFLRGPLLLR
jgi:pimeloyl-ACP methyl ester carboxylesterase